MPLAVKLVTMRRASGYPAASALTSGTAACISPTEDACTQKTLSPDWTLTRPSRPRTGPQLPVCRLARTAAITRNSGSSRISSRLYRLRMSETSYAADDPGGRDAFLEVQHANLAARLDHFFIAGDFLGPVIAALHENVGLHPGDELARRVGAERHHPVHRVQCLEHRHALRERHDRPLRSLETAHGFISVDRDDQAVAQRARFLQVGDVAGMQDVEAAIGHHHALAALACVAHRLDQLVFLEDAGGAPGAMLDGELELGGRDARRAQPRDHEARGEIA